MPENPLRVVLQESVEEILETMFFVQSANEPAGPSGQPEVVAHLTFEGRPSGWLTLRVPGAAARAVAADFLGEEEPSLSGQQVGEVVAELSNMICGSVLSRIESTTAFRLAVPDVWTGLAASPPFVPPHAVVHVAGIGKGDLVVIFQTETPACPTTEQSAY